MQNDNQNLTPDDSGGAKPDYSFLQEYTPATAEQAHKKMDKKVLLIIVLLVLTGLVLLVGLLMGPNNDTLNQNDNLSSQSLFVNSISNGNLDEAYEKLAPALAERYKDKTSFTEEVGEPMRKLLLENDCKQLDIDRATDQNSIIFRCQFGDVPAWFGVGLTELGQVDEQVYKLCTISTEELTQCRD